MESYLLRHTVNVSLKNINRKCILRGSLVAPEFSCRNAIVVRFCHRFLQEFIDYFHVTQEKCMRYLHRLHISRYAGMRNPPNFIPKER